MLTLTNAELIEAAAMRLSPEQRSRLADRLLASLRGEELSAGWHAEIDRRLDRLDAGDVELIDAEEVLAKLDNPGR